MQKSNVPMSSTVYSLVHIPVKISHQLKSCVEVFVRANFYAWQISVGGEHVVHENRTPANDKQHDHGDQHFHHLST